MTLWKPEDSVTIIEGIHWIHSLRLVSDTMVEILTDPWHPDSAIWRFDTPGMQLWKVADFPKYREEPYTEEIDW